MGKFHHYNSYRLAGFCTDGNIYDDNYKRLGTYSDGRVYDDHYTRMGTYEKGRVYDNNYTLVGTYENGICYDRNYSRVCTYEDDDAEAAAYLLLMLKDPSDCAAACTGGSVSSAGIGVCPGSSVSGAETGSGADVAIILLGGFLLLTAPLSLLAIWWAIIKATGPAEMPFLIIFLISILLGICLGMAVLKAGSWFELYVCTVIVAGLICIVTSFFTNNGYSVFVIIPAALFVVALASVVPTVLVFYSVNLIRIGIIKGKQRQAKKAAQSEVLH